MLTRSKILKLFAIIAKLEDKRKEIRAIELTTFFIWLKKIWKKNKVKGLFAIDIQKIVALYLKKIKIILYIKT